VNRIGFAATYGFSSIREAIEFGDKNNFKAVELSLNMPEFFPERYSAKERNAIRELAIEKGMTLTFHAPEDVNLCTKQRYILDASIKRLKECIDFACDLGGVRFTFHIGDSVNFTMYNGSLHLEDYYKDDYIEILKASIGELCLYASLRIEICAENTGYFSPAKIEAIESLLGKGLHLTWDIGHSFIKKNQHDFMGKNIVHVRIAHIHDVIKGKDHSIIGTGEVDIPYYISLLDSDEVIYIIEVRPADAAVESYKNLKKILKIEDQSVES